MKLKTAYRGNPLIGPGPIEGTYAWKVERAIEKRFNVKHAVVISSGTAALHVALLALDLRFGDQVITSALTFAATAGAIVLAGGTPVFADVDPKTFCITPKKIKAVITDRTRAIVPVHLFGNVCDVQGIRDLGYAVIEDAAQAVGCRRRDTFGYRYAGTLGLAGIYSFGGMKQVSAGEGGAIVTNSDAVAKMARLSMNHGECFGSFVGYNYRPNEVTCRLILSEFGKLKDNTPFKVPYLVKKRRKNDKPYISEPIYELPAFRRFKRKRLPITEQLCRRTLCVR